MDAAPEGQVAQSNSVSSVPNRAGDFESHAGTPHLEEDSPVIPHKLHVSNHEGEDQAAVEEDNDMQTPPSGCECGEPLSTSATAEELSLVDVDDDVMVERTELLPHHCASTDCPTRDTADPSDDSGISGQDDGASLRETTHSPPPVNPELESAAGLLQTEDRDSEMPEIGIPNGIMANLLFSFDLQ